ncbi:hypothetical protein AY586_02150 [Marichromatium gracile]|uniref:Uncharacterized protein n=1 Tax=Marichromatium gracile TaxID=1048 RepID=A0ABR5VHF0_MARGR|nr:hypothetical protein AY586_02150 [Marichromatium gracile]
MIPAGQGSCPGGGLGAGASSPQRAQRARARQLGERAGALAVDHQLQVVEGRVGLAVGVAPAGVLGLVRAAVPAPFTEVEAAAEGQCVVDDHQLLVVTGRQRVVVIEGEVQARVLAPGVDAEEQRFALERVDRRIVPEQDPGLEPGGAFEQGMEQFAESGRQPVAGVLAHQLELTVQVPAEDQDAMPGIDQCPAQGGEVAFAVDQWCQTAGAGDLPAGLAGYQQRGGCVTFHRRSSCSGGAR